MRLSSSHVAFVEDIDKIWFTADGRVLVFATYQAKMGAVEINSKQRLWTLREIYKGGMARIHGSVVLVPVRARRCMDVIDVQTGAYLGRHPFPSSQSLDFFVVPG